jgi:hypothetical protein
VANCKIPHEEGWTKVINCNSWSLQLTFHPLQKANEIADCLENQFTPHDLRNENRNWQVEARLQALFEAADNNPHKRIGPCDLQKFVNSLNSCLQQYVLPIMTKQPSHNESSETSTEKWLLCKRMWVEVKLGKFYPSYLCCLWWDNYLESLSQVTISEQFSFSFIQYKCKT